MQVKKFIEAYNEDKTSLKKQFCKWYMKNYTKQDGSQYSEVSIETYFRDGTYLLRYPELCFDFYEVIYIDEENEKFRKKLIEKFTTKSHRKQPYNDVSTYMNDIEKIRAFIEK